MHLFCHTVIEHGYTARPAENTLCPSLKDIPDPAGPEGRTQFPRLGVYALHNYRSGQNAEQASLTT